MYKYNTMNHGTHASGRVSSQQQHPFHPSVFGTVCPPQWLPMLVAYATPSSSLVSLPPPPSRSPNLGARRKLGFGDVDNYHVKGKRTVIFVLISPDDVSTLGAWDNGAIKNTYQSKPKDWVKAVVRGAPVTPCAAGAPKPTPNPPLTLASTSPQMAIVNARMKSWSWGNVEFEWTVVGPLRVGYTSGNCGVCSINQCGRGGGANGESDKDVLGAAAVAGTEYDVNNYDYQVYWQPEAAQVDTAAATQQPLSCAQVPQPRGQVQKPAPFLVQRVGVAAALEPLDHLLQLSPVHGDEDLGRQHRRRPAR